MWNNPFVEIPFNREIVDIRSKIKKVKNNIEN